MNSTAIKLGVNNGTLYCSSLFIFKPKYRVKPRNSKPMKFYYCFFFSLSNIRGIQNTYLHASKYFVDILKLWLH